MADFIDLPPFCLNYSLPHYSFWVTSQINKLYPNSHLISAFRKSKLRCSPSSTNSTKDQGYVKIRCNQYNDWEIWIHIISNRTKMHCTNWFRLREVITIVYFNKIDRQVMEVINYYYSTEPGKSPPEERLPKRASRTKCVWWKSKCTRITPTFLRKIS